MTLSINTLKPYASNEYSGYADLGNLAVLDFQTAMEPFTKGPLSAASNIEFADGAFITIRGVPFAGYLAPFPDTINTDRRLKAYTNTKKRYMSHTFNTGTHAGCKIRTNFLLNRRLFGGVKIGQLANIELETYYNSPNNPGMSVTATLDAKIKKVDSGGTITTLKTFTQKTLSSDTGQTTTFRDVFIEDNNTIATVNEDDIVYIETELTYSTDTSNGAGEYGLANNEGRVAHLSIDL